MSPIYKKILATCRIFVGDIRLILAEYDLHLNELTRNSLENDLRIVRMNMDEITLLSANAEEFERRFACVADWDHEKILSVILTDTTRWSGEVKS